MYTLDAAFQLTDDATDYGLYQIYGAHFVYGVDVLLYIGKSEQQTFGARLWQHYSDWISAEHDWICTTVYVGRLAGTTTPPDALWSHHTSARSGSGMR